MTLKDLSDELHHQEQLLEVIKRYMQTNMGFLDYMQALESKDRCEQKIRLLEAQIEQVMGDTEI